MNPFLVVHPRVHRAHRLKSTALGKIVDGLSLCCWCKTSTNVAKYTRTVGVFSFHWRHF